MFYFKFSFHRILCANSYFWEIEPLEGYSSIKFGCSHKVKGNQETGLGPQ